MTDLTDEELRARVAKLEAALTNLLIYALNGEGAGLISSELELDPVFIEARAALAHVEPQVKRATQ